MRILLVVWVGPSRLSSLALASSAACARLKTGLAQWADRQWMRFLDPKNDVGGPMGGMTNDEMLRRGMDGSEHPVMQMAASARY